MNLNSPLLKRLVEKRNGRDECFIDRDGERFGKVLESMRDGIEKFRVPIDPRERDVLRHEAVFLEMEPLVQSIDRAKAATDYAETNVAILKQFLKHLHKKNRRNLTLTAVQTQILVNFASEIKRADFIKKSKSTLQGTEGQASLAGFNRESIRALQMRRTLSEAMALVWRPESTDKILKGYQWRILYTNEQFKHMTGLHALPNYKLPAAFLGSESGNVISNSLNTVLSVHGGCPKVNELSTSDVLSPFDVWATLRAPNKFEQRVACRFDPASLPLDANAAAIKPRPVGDKEELRRPCSSTRNNMTGYLYFLTMVAT